jgi:chromosome partitioning protein
MKILVFFNHKGGVGKTTLVYNLGLALAHHGTRVLFIDADAQANLTAAAMAPLDIEATYNAGRSVADALMPLVDGSGDLAAVRPTQIRETAWIVPGHIRLSEYEEICPQGWTDALAGNVRGLRVTTAPYRLAQVTGDGVGAEVVVFDVGPNVGGMNRNILLSADGFVVPLAPDLFSLNALSSVGRSAALWINEWEAILGAVTRRNLDIDIPMPPGKPVPLGYISQQFATYRQAPADAYRRWLHEIPAAYRREVVKPLEAVGVKAPSGEDRLGEVRNLSSLVPMAQRSNRAIFELSGSEARGAQFTRAQDTLTMFAGIADQIVARLA